MTIFIYKILRLNKINNLNNFNKYNILLQDSIYIIHNFSPYIIYINYILFLFPLIIIIISLHLTIYIYK